MEQSTALLSHFAQVEDPRVDRTKRYPLIEIIFLVISATISGSAYGCNPTINKIFFRTSPNIFNVF